jgi:hypothetical protein
MVRRLPLVLVFVVLAAFAGERVIESKHLRVLLNQSRDAVAVGGTATLTAQVQLPAKMHVYAPSIEPPYKPIALTLEAPAGVKLSAVRYPQSKKLRLEAIDGTVPVYEGTFTLQADAVIARTMKAGNTVINGKLSYQTCDDKICYLPVTLPVSWIVKVTPVTSAKAAPSK